MRVKIFTLTDVWGGAEVHTAALADTLASRGHEVLIVQIGHRVYERDGRHRRPGIELAHIDTGPFPNLIGSVEWLRRLRGLRGGLAVFPKGTHYAMSAQFDIALRLSYSALVTIEHLACEPMPPKRSRRYLGGLLPGVGLWWYKALFARYARSLGPNRVVCVSNAVRARLADECRFPSRKMTTVQNGIDPERFRQSPRDRQRIRRELGVSDEALVFGSIGRLHSQKAYDVALAAFSELVAGNPQADVHLAIAGDGELKDELLARAKASGLDGRFHLLGFTDRPWEAYSAFDVFVLSSRNEGLPFALIEAMACERCSIATSVGGVPEVLADSGAGWMVEPENPSQLAAAMHRALVTPAEQRIAMGRRARTHMTTHFDSRVQYATLADVLEGEAGAISRGAA
jgi:glycosyltransferase involved in cell wall biosynthesis